MTSQLPIEAIVRRIVHEVLGKVGTMEPDEVLDRTNLCLRNARLIAIGDLQDRLDGINQITTGRRTVVTPAAIDLLRERGIALVRDQDESVTEKAASHEVTFTVYDRDSSQRADAFTIQLNRRIGGATTVATQTQANIILADLPQPVVFELCKDGKKAAQVGSINETQEIWSAMQPNVWVLDMKRLNLPSAVNTVARLPNR